MILLPIALVFAGYSIGSWGYVLVKGYNITLREWFTPLHPWTGALDKNGMVPQGQIFPGKGGAPAGQGGGGNIQANPPGAPPGAPNPHGQVQ